MPARVAALATAALLSMGLAACDRGATKNANAPGSPGTGNATGVVVPSAPDGPSGAGPSGVKGSMPHPGSSGGDARPGVTGAGTLDSQASQRTGSGLQGGMGAGGTGMTGSFPAGAASSSANSSPGAADGSSNRTPSGAVGRR